MKQLTQMLEKMFSAFDSDEAIDLKAHRKIILDHAASLALEFEQMEQKIAESREAYNDNDELREIIVNDCRAKLILLGENNAEDKARHLSGCAVSDLRAERDAILKQYDSRFAIVESSSHPHSHESELAEENIQAYQS